MNDTAQYVYVFGTPQSVSTPQMRDVLGDKGANLATMAQLGLPVPPGFTITTEICTMFLRDGDFPPSLRMQVEEGLAAIGAAQGKKFGDIEVPLLVSVRSGGRQSMPGMLDTILNLGLNDASCAALADATNNPRFAWESYCRFIRMFGDVVLGIESDIFEAILDDYRLTHDLLDDVALTANDWQAVCIQLKACIADMQGATFPQDPHEQIWAAIRAVFKSWNNNRAQTYRQLHNISDECGTAVNVQAMVFGNLGATSATGVAFTRNPTTGIREVYGEYLLNAQGEDIVAGARTPHYISRAEREAAGETVASLEEILPTSYHALTQCFEQLETHFGDMQDIEFTIEDNKLWLLQTRNGKRSIHAALKITVDMVGEGLVDEATALCRLDPLALDQLLHPHIDSDADYELLTNGLPASPGAASGAVVFTSQAAEAALERGTSVILVRMETSPEDIHGMYAAAGILTSRGGMTSHAAIIARRLGRPCITGARAMRIDTNAKSAQIGDMMLHEGDIITIDGHSGRIMRGIVPMRIPTLSDDFTTIMAWADKHRRLSVRVNAESEADIQTALHFGAEGVGLCCTEHMFFEPSRITHTRAMILANNDATARQVALSALEPIHCADFRLILQASQGKPIAIRLLDAPLHMFLPQNDSGIEALANAHALTPAAMHAQIARLRETNPILGHRGMRLAMTYPEIYDMQIRALFCAMQAQEANSPPCVEIMLPFIIDRQEFRYIATRISDIAEQMARDGYRPTYHIGAMLETPRAALIAGELAQEVDFLSFGTNDLTQTTLGISRDDARIFLSNYIDQRIFAADPFTQIDTNGVGALMQLATQEARARNPNIKIGICGEHGGDPSSIAFCTELKLDYISCTTARIPLARLAAAQAQIAAL